MPVNPLTGAPMRHNIYDITAGDLNIIDQNGDYFISTSTISGYNSDKLRMGNPNPKLTGGFINTVSYKGWTLGVTFTYLFGRDVLDVGTANLFDEIRTISDVAYYGLPDISGFTQWKQSGDKANFPLINLYGKYYFTPATTLWYQRGDYVRLKNLNLGYMLTPANSGFVRKAKISTFRIYAMADNLWLWKKAKTIPDPENVNVYGDYTGNGYPIPKKITLGFSIGF